MRTQDPNNWSEKLATQARILSGARMLRDEQLLTEEITKQILTRTQDYLRRTGKSQEWAARSLGIGATTLSQIFSGNYAGDVEKMVRSIDKWNDQQERKETAPKPAGFVKTKVAGKMYGVARWIQQIGAIGLIHGPAGSGKTITAKAIAAETPGSVYMCVSTAGQRKRPVLMALASACRIPGLEITADMIFAQLESLLRDTGRLIIIDEVHKLAGRANDEALHVLRDLHDATGCPMLWIGQTNIHTYIKQQKSRFEPLDQIDSRIKFRLDITSMVNQEDGGDGLFTINDIREWIDKQGIKLKVADDALRYLQMVANTPGMGGLRTCDGLIRVAVHIAKADEPMITADKLRGILSDQHGARYVESFERQSEIRRQAVA